MQLETTLLLWNIDDREALQKAVQTGVNNIAISVDAGEVDEDILTALQGLGRSVLAKQNSTREAIEDLCYILDTVEVFIDCSSIFISPEMDYDEVILGLDPEVYKINLLITPSILDELRVAADNGFEDVHPVFIYHGTVDKILKNLSKEVPASVKRESIAITFVEYMDRPVFYSNKPLFFAFTDKIIFWSVTSLDQMILEEPPVVEKAPRANGEIECVKTTSVRIAPSFASRIDTNLSVKPGDRFIELEHKRPVGSTAEFSKISINGVERWVVRTNNTEVYFADVE